MRYALLFLLLPFAVGNLVAQTSTVSRDNGRVAGNHGNAVFFEETVILSPAGPGRIVEIQMYFTGSTAASDTFMIVGDPAEGYIPPTAWVWAYNLLAPPLILTYDGQPGWKTFDLREFDLRTDGRDRVVIQHRIDQGGLVWSVDNNQQSVPFGSWLMDPNATNSLGGPGEYSIAGGDFLVRLVVEYDYPLGTGSANPPPPRMVDATKGAGLVGGDGNKVGSQRVSVADWNGDGWDDVAAGSTFWQNNGDGTFAIVPLGISAAASTWGDYDNDGDLDCFAVQGGTANDSLYRNDGGGVFTDVTAASEIVNPAPTITPIWFDFNEDGRLDLFISNGRTGDYPNEVFYQDKLWLNDGDGTFTDVTASTGIPQTEGAPYYDAWGAAPGDYNADGRTDIFVATYRLAPDILYRNVDGETLTDVAAGLGVQGVPTGASGQFGHGIGAEFADYNNDGLIDITVGNLGHPDFRGLYSNPSLIFRNEGPPLYRFTEVHQDLGLKFFEMNAGVVWGDFDLDGDQDLFHCQYAYQPKNFEHQPGILYEPERLSRIYMNGGAEENWKLNDRTWHTGLRIHGAWTAARLDHDRDGDLDLLVASSHDGLTLYRNELVREGRAIVIRLEGDPAQEINADAYGTTVRIYSEGVQHMRQLGGGGSGATATQNANALHFGVGQAETVDSIVVEFGSGIRKVFADVATSREYRISPTMTEPEEVRTYAISSVMRHEADDAFAVSDARFVDDAIEFGLRVERPCDVDVELVDVTGKRVAFRTIRVAASGTHRLEIEEMLPKGAYVLRVAAGALRSAAKVNVVR